jgi:hypothetical protein
MEVKWGGLVILLQCFTPKLVPNELTLMKFCTGASIAGKFNFGLHNSNATPNLHEA